MTKNDMRATALVLAIIGLSGLICRIEAAESIALSSPDGNIKISFSLKDGSQPDSSNAGAPCYRISYKGNPVLADSPLGLVFLESAPLDRDFKVVGTDRESHNSTWENPFGTKRTTPDKYRQLTVSLRERGELGRRMDIVFRAYNEGVAFRYFLPKQKALDKFTIASEKTGFNFVRDVDAYALNMGRFNTHNEGEYRRTPLKDIKPESIINLPLLVEVPGGPWVGLLEADLTDYAGMYVGGVAGVENALVAKLSVTPGRKPEEAVIGETPKATPWRVLLIGPTAGSLIEANYLILNLSPPCALADTSWIKPGKTAWDWWSGTVAKNVNFTPGMNTPTMEHYVDFSSAHHLEYMLIDAGWYTETTDKGPGNLLESIPEINIPEIVEYAKVKGVKVLLWVEWQTLDRQLDEATALFEKWGLAGIKVDYMNRDDQEMVNLYEKWVRKAAEHHLAVDFHGAYKGTGLCRTYPNLLTREGVMGMEYCKWTERVTPEHDVTIPFTRMLAGPMDFTPGGFRNAARGQFKVQGEEPMTQGTRAHQLAMYVVYESPLMMVSDYPEAYEKQPGLEFIEKVPTVWDDTKVLSGEPARFVTIARRKGRTWYLGAMTNWDSRDMALPLDFLGKGNYEAQIFADGPDAETEGTSLSITTKRVNAGEKLNVHLASGGGLAVIFTPVK